MARLLDRCLPGNRRLTVGAETANLGGGVRTCRLETGPVTYSFKVFSRLGAGPARDDDKPHSHAATRAPAA